MSRTNPRRKINSKFLSEEERRNKPEITPQLLKRIFSYLRPYWKQMLLVLLMIVISSYLSILPSLLTGKIIDDGIIAKNLPLLIKLIILSLGVTLASNLIGVLESYVNTWVGQQISFDMKNKMFRHLQAMSHEFFTSNNQGDIISRMTSDISGVQQLISGTLTSILSNVIILIVALVSMYRRDWILATIGIIIVPLFTLPTKKVGKMRWKLTRDAQEKNDLMNGILNEKLSVSGQLLVKLFNKEDYEAKQYERISREMMDLNMKERMSGRWFRVVIGTFSSIGPMLIYLIGGFLIIRHKSSITVGDITVMVALLSRMYVPVNTLMSMQVDWIRSMALFKRIFEYFDMPLKIHNPDNPLRPAFVNGDVKFTDVNFSYQDGKQTLKNINLSIDAGKKVAIVGPSGAGKSSLVNLLPRIFDADSGSITIDGNDIRELDLHFLREHVGMVTQDTYLFNGSIRENLLYAKADASEDELISACKRANIYDFISNQENGLETVVGNRGLKLSGGEKQRISIARALLKNPAILILDEATSSLDSISEHLIQEALAKLTAKRTSIVIAHRLSTIMEADEILVMKAGEIVERGRHDELLQQDGLYKVLYTTQFTESKRDKSQILPQLPKRSYTIGKRQ